MRKPNLHVDNPMIIQPKHLLPLPAIVLCVASATLAKLIAAQCKQLAIICVGLE